MHTLLSKKQRAMHPRGQVQTLVRMAKVALGKYDRELEYSGTRNDALWDKAHEALVEAIKLNEEHALGYVVHLRMLPQRRH